MSCAPADYHGRSDRSAGAVEADRIKAQGSGAAPPQAKPVKPPPDDRPAGNGLGQFRRVPPFCHLDAALVTWLRQHVERRRHETGSYPVEQDRTFTRIEMIVRGTADLVTRDKCRREVVFGSLAPGQLYGFTASFCEGLALYSVRTASCLEVLSLDRADFDYVIRKNVAVRDYFYQEAMARIRQAYLRASGLEAPTCKLYDGGVGIPSRLAKPLAYIQANYYKSLTLEKVASAGGMSQCHFSRLFKSLMGCRFKEYLNQCRVEAAKDLLQKGDKNITDVCYAVGFNDLSYFTRVFKKHAGTTPSAYRRII